MDLAEIFFHYRTPPATGDIPLTPMVAIFTFVVGVAYVAVWCLITNVYFMLSVKNEEEVIMRNLSTEAETENLQGDNMNN